ncbi:MAG: transposase [Leptolyngbyaceae cyanobacterium MO_188.B28]|nr:transposase [Leptolyngbyaceae cyanobacterium MO_188.B28]
MTDNQLTYFDYPKRPAYPSNFGDAEWKALELLLPQAKGFSRPRTVDIREILNTVFCVQRTEFYTV